MDLDLTKDELEYTAVRSGGPGGQHANKVSSKVVLTFDLWHSKALNDQEKIRISQKLSSKFNKQGKLILTCDQSRSQHKNKEIVYQRFLKLISGAVKKEKKRIPTKIGRLKKKKRLDEKKKHSYKKSLRQKPRLD
ncbi:alternative ribosome rescue aminoacyl-tRNA hydrolase ArfB [Lutimonas zeaxanthinifaciens]|uniref:alternative ribosome rescue aminoacyl-tRNA hydrolase ArfB n=1 Tax=Lutimonas zeaxanthinifaciens TaxID=3060215 RepID=UPI00265D42BA|nr:alternative ribosome rescue aminoacyl-tRNA hydrolase ArfB [Lutimonas sp. YSD2104]WKK66135.1 alternative ribosome rescue aminoacyl-tRNA hydrolase ArfB [Lutimonas sp. YSD2104]